MEDLSNNEPSEAEQKKANSEPKENVEESSKGKVKGSLFGIYLKSGSNFCVLSIVLTLFLLTQAAASVIDWWVSYWTAQEELRTWQKEQKVLNLLANDTDFVDFLPTKRTMTQDILAALESGSEPLPTNWCAIIHGSLLVALFIFAITRSISFYQSTVRASQKLHDKMVSFMRCRRPISILWSFSVYRRGFGSHEIF